MASDAKRLAWVRRQPCAVCATPGPNHAHHSTSGQSGADGPKALGGRRGKGQKASDTETIALCIKHHANLHDLRGFFSGYTKNELRDWQDTQVRLHQARYEEHLALQGEPLPKVDEAGKELGVDILAGGSTDPKELAEMLGSVHGLAPAAVHDAERQLRHMKKAARA
jgi:hypothetical protein